MKKGWARVLKISCFDLTRPIVCRSDEGTVAATIEMIPTPGTHKPDQYNAYQRAKKGLIIEKGILYEQSRDVVNTQVSLFIKC